MPKMLDLFWHEHRLFKTNGRIFDHCHECHEQIGKTRDLKPLYRCYGCNIEWHPSCVPSSPENINHRCHMNHPLELLLQGPPSYSDGKCSICQHKLSNFVYHCKLCDFSVGMNCANDPPTLVVDHPKCHEHALTRIGVRNVSFTCNACATHGEGIPYVCIPCSLMFHYSCMNLPRVININRHDHRISHAYPLTRGDWVCEICRQDVNWRYGGYACKECPDFFAHSRCATRKDVWDGIELEGIPEEVVETAPFKVVKEGVINHFSHRKHNLLLIEDVGEDMHCEACARPISSEKRYKCMECDFLLHEECANLPLRKRHGLSTRILSLRPGNENNGKAFKCVACRRVVSGFRYEDGNGVVLDVRCATLSFFWQSKLHPHPLFLTTLDRGTCVGCGKSRNYVLSCVECEYTLGFECATLPVVMKHRCDDHLLTLSSGEKAATGRYWCEVCEAETNPEKWFYTCGDCGVVCHVDCVVGDSLNVKPGFSRMGDGTKLEAVLNDHNSRPECIGCSSRCRFPMAYKVYGVYFKAYYCSLMCDQDYV